MYVCWGIQSAFLSHIDSGICDEIPSDAVEEANKEEYFRHPPPATPIYV